MAPKRKAAKKASAVTAALTRPRRSTRSKHAVKNPQDSISEEPLQIKQEPEDDFQEDVKPTGLNTKHSGFLKIMHKFQQESLFCDVALKSSDGGLVMTHACVIAAACPFLCDLLIECKPSYLTLETSLSSSQLDQIVNFIYSGEVSFPESDRNALFDSAIIFGLDLQKAGQSIKDGSVTLNDIDWPRSLFATLRQFQQKGTFCDATLKSTVDNGLFMAHTCVLAASRNILSKELAVSGFFPQKVQDIIEEESET